MKNILYIPLIFLLFACTNEYIMQANLGIVSDNDFAKLNFHKRKNGINSDSIFSNFNVRRLRMIYYVVNEFSDSVFIPIGYPLTPPLVANIDYHDSLETSIWTPGIARYCAPQDTVYFYINIDIESKNAIGREWLQKTSTKELVSKIHLEMTKPTKEKDVDRIPYINFNNDTSYFNINPVFVFKNNKAIVVYDNDSLAATVGDY